MWVIKTRGVYLGDRDGFVDEKTKAHKFRYKKEALDHAAVFALFHEWVDGEITTTVEKA